MTTSRSSIRTYRSPLLAAPAIVALVLTAVTSPARAITSVITFDNIVQGTIATNALSGAVITGASVLTQGSALNPPFPPHSGSNVVFDYLDGTISIAFSGPETSVGAYITTNRALTLTLYNGASVVGSQTTPFGANYTGASSIYGPNYFFSLSAPSITSAVFTNGLGISNTFTIDDLTIVGDTAVGVIPEPSTWALMMGGVAALAFGRRRRRDR